MIKISEEKYKCLRKHLDEAFNIMAEIGVELGSDKKLPKAPKETQKQKIAKYDAMITGKTKYRKPDYLKK